MPFRFSLEAVLRFRQSLERRERQRLEVITREVVNAKAQQQAAQRDRVNARAQFQNKLHQGMTAAEMQFELASDRARQRRIAALDAQMAKLEDLRRRQLEVFLHAQQQREIVENLRARQLAAYRLDQARRDQQQADERYLISHARQPSAG